MNRSKLVSIFSGYRLPSSISLHLVHRASFAAVAMDFDKTRLAEHMKRAFDWSFEPRAMQVEAGMAQIHGEDVLVHAPTGMGKTAIVAAPHVAPHMKGRITIFVSPLIALQEEMVMTFKVEYKLSAIAVNSTRRKQLNKVMQVCSNLRLDLS